MKDRTVLGHIDCPACGHAQGMRVTHDRNGHPFGYCEANCSAQLRIGGDSRRLAAFLARYPWAGKQGHPAGAGAPVTGTGTAAAAPAAKAAPAQAPKAPEPKPAPAKASAPAPAAPARTRTPFDDAIRFLGGEA